MAKIDRIPSNIESGKEIKPNRQDEIKNTVGPIILTTITSSKDGMENVIGESDIDSEKKMLIAKKYFTDISVLSKVLKKEMNIIERFPQIYRLFLKDPSLFKKFYLKKFQKEANTINDLNDQEKYGVLVVKAKELINNEKTENFFDTDYKEIPRSIKFPVKGKRSRSPWFGKYKED